MQSLAQKYRPKSFSDVVGQKNIIHILSNQIEHYAFKQAYLFTGGAGTGKTTSARIFANNIDAEIVEIDGASNNGVDNIREIIEQIKFKPIKHQFKVFIIDEVHMLSTGAFNALLKIIEEPPKHAIFIFATTDPQKIPATILSRVQRFDFKRMTTAQIVERLKHIVDMENNEVECDSEGTASNEFYIEITDDALEYIAKLSQGGMRSAISILDTCLGYDNKLNLEAVIEILGASNYDLFFSLASSIIGENHARIVELLEEEHINGKDLKQLVKGFTEFVVDVLKFSLVKNFDYTSLPSIYQERTEKMLQHVKQSELRQWFTKLTELNNRIKYETTPKTMIVGEFLCL